MTWRRRWFVALVPVLAAQLATAQPSAEGENIDVKLTTIEGEVLGIAELPGESDLPLVVVALGREGETEPLELLLAPKGVLEEIGFEVEVGDRLKVRIFADGRSPAHAQRVMNVTRDTLVRLRTLRHTPLWSGTGAWQGGGARDRPGVGPGGRPEGGPGGHGPGRGA